MVFANVCGHVVIVIKIIRTEVFWKLNFFDSRKIKAKRYKNLWECMLGNVTVLNLVPSSTHSHTHFSDVKLGLSDRYWSGEVSLIGASIFFFRPKYKQVKILTTDIDLPSSQCLFWVDTTSPIMHFYTSVLFLLALLLLHTKKKQLFFGKWFFESYKTSQFYYFLLQRVISVKCSQMSNIKIAHRAKCVILEKAVGLSKILNVSNLKNTPPSVIGQRQFDNFYSLTKDNVALYLNDINTRAL